MTELTISTLPPAPLHVSEIWSNPAAVAKRFKATCGFALPHMGRSGLASPSDQPPPNLTITPCSYNVLPFFDSQMRHPITPLLRASLPPQCCRKFYCAPTILRNMVRFDLGVNLRAILGILGACCTFGSKQRGVWRGRFGFEGCGALLSVWPECGWQADIVRASEMLCILHAHGSPWAYTSLASASAS